MIPQAGTTCSFTFLAKFEALNGVYHVRSLVGFTDAVAAGMDFMAYLYTPAGLTDTDYAQDFAGYKSDTVCVLEAVSDRTIQIYVPQSIFLTVPDPSIRTYYPASMTVFLGPHADPQVLLPLQDQIADLVKASLGVTDPVRIRTSSKARVYLTDAQYADLEAAREANKTVLTPVSMQLAAAQDQITTLAARCAAYEALLVQMSTTP